MNYQLIKPRVPQMTEVEQVFHNRGIEPQNLKHYLYTTADDLLDPAEIANIEAGTKMLIKHIANGDKIFVQVDSDCDGFTSSALLLNYLNRLFPAAVQHNFDYRLHTGKEHGLILETIPEDIKLVIAPDSSSNDYDIHAALADRGVDVLVIDHHLADHISEHACIINNQMCNYPTKSLSGVGMVYKFCSYIDSLLNKNIADDYLDLAALGIIADVMELKDFETRYIVEQGMKNVRNPFIAAMVDRQSFKLSKGLTPIGVAFYIAPYVNAINRSGDIDERLLLFESMLEYRAYEQIPSTKRGCRGQMETRVEQAVRTCNNVKNRQGKARDDLTSMAEEQIKENGLLSDVVIIIKIPKTQAINKNLTGLIATQIANKYRHPTLILNETEHDGEKWWEGSGRGAPHIPITNTRQTLLDTGCVEYIEGHENAFGIGIKDESLYLFKNTLNTKYKNIDFSPCYFVDLIMNAEYDPIDKVVLELANLENYWGQGVDEPVIAFTNIKVTNDNISLLKESTLKIDCGNYNFIKLGTSSPEEYDAINPGLGIKTLTIIGTCAINDWGGYMTPQIKIMDYEVTGSIPYYF